MQRTGDRSIRAPTIRAIHAARGSRIEPIEHLVEQTWDAIVVGTGMGGGTLGFALAAAGLRVLFCERGSSNLHGRGFRGAYAPSPAAPVDSDAPGTPSSPSSGLRRDPVVDVSQASPRSFLPFIGEGTGGSSGLYGMVLERLFPADLDPSGTPGGEALGAAWPIAYADLAPYYAKAETLFGVRGTGDPLRRESDFGYVARPPAYSPAAQELADAFAAQGLHPYHLPLACNYRPGCVGCQGYLCGRSCKIDSANACVEPAIERHGASLLDEFDVIRLESTSRRVTAVIGRCRGRQYRLTSELVILAAGALATPLLLLRSGSPDWPDGLANASGLVGRNLMRHYVDLYAVFTRHRPDPTTNQKEVGINDLYHASGEKLGSVQSFGPMPPGRVLVDSIEDDLRSQSRALAALFRGVKPLMRPLLDALFSRATILATIVEDEPARDNVVFERIANEAGHTAFRYAIGPSDRRRIARMRERTRAILKGYRYLSLKQAENNQRLAHVCGTCRFGDDPATSVLDRHNQAHGLDNLFVVDASFFPTSGGTNPSLTVAANALRVADFIVGARSKVS